MRLALRFAFLVLALVAGVLAPAWADQGGGTAGAPVAALRGQPCDLLSGGCLSAYSVVERMTQGYQGPLFQVYRSDGQTNQIGTIASTAL